MPSRLLHTGNDMLRATKGMWTIKRRSRLLYNLLFCRGRRRRRHWPQPWTSSSRKLTRSCSLNATPENWRKIHFMPSSVEILSTQKTPPNSNKQCHRVLSLPASRRYSTRSFSTASTPWEPATVVLNSLTLKTCCSLSWIRRKKKIVSESTRLLIISILIQLLVARDRWWKIPMTLTTIRTKWHRKNRMLPATALLQLYSKLPWHAEQIKLQ